MAKKKITGASKLRRQDESISQEEEILNLITPNKETLPKSYRLKETDIRNLNAIYTEINKICPTKVSETKIIRALILMGTKIKKDRILNYIRDLW